MPPMRDQPRPGLDSLPVRQISVAEFVGELGALISELEAGRGGNQAIDVRIHHGFHVMGGFGEDMASVLIKEGVSWPTVQTTLGEIVPPYSTSLDAALHGEDIVFSIRAAKGHRWGAMQRTSSGSEILAWAATEPLARRLAALKTWHAELEKSLEDDKIPTHPLDDQRAAMQPESDRDSKQNIPYNGADRSEAGDLANLNRDVTPLGDSPQDAALEPSDQEEQDWKILF